MKKMLILVLLFQYGFSQTIPKNVKKLMRFYPQIVDFKDNKLFFKDKSTLLYDDKKEKMALELIENPDIEDQFFYDYQLGNINDAGRIRNEDFFKKIYGNSKAEVEKNLVEIVWCPKLVNQKIKVNRINGIDKIIQKLSLELDNHPEYKIYLTNIAGTFNWRKIAGTTRLSMHSFGMTIDINTKYSNYWQWDCKCKNEETKLSYKNKIPKNLIYIFEKYGFIWGGNWYHYDTMHFEYRPEMLIDIKQ
jgi:D-alanyl-D-alanine carboxypeptidase